MTRTENIARFVEELKYEDLPPKVIRAAKKMIMDTIGAGLATTFEDPWKADMAWKIAKFNGGKEEATAFVSGLKLPAGWAAFANAVLCHGVDFDDTHNESICHVGSPTVPSALAITQAVGGSGKDLILAAVIGYEISVRVGMCVMPSHYQYWHATATDCTFGNGALTAKLYEGDAKSVINALGLAGTSAAGLLTFVKFGDFSKSFNPGKSAFNGILAGTSAILGATAPPVMLESETGYSYAYCREEPKLEKLDEGLGTKYEILENMPKLYPSLLASHTPIEAVLYLRRKYHIEAEDIVRITNRTVSLVNQFSNFDPQTTMAARLSVPYCIAVAAATGTVDLSSFTMDVINSKEVRDLLTKVEIVPDDEAETYVLNKPSFLTIETKDGKFYEHRVCYSKGHTNNPVTQDELEGKFSMLATSALGTERAKSLIDACNDLENITNVHEFASMLVKG